MLVQFGWQGTRLPGDHDTSLQTIVVNFANSRMPAPCCSNNTNNVNKNN